jgi:hypothetical protein
MERGWGFYLFVLVLILVFFAADRLTSEDGDTAVIRRALMLYRDMHAGQYQVVVVSSAVSNGRHWLKTEIRAAGLTFPGLLSFPVPRVDAPKNSARLLAGGVIGGEYGRRLFGPLWIYAGGGWRDAPVVWGGVGLQW